MERLSLSLQLDTENNMTALTKQEERVLTYLQQNDEINPLSSWKHCGVYRLAAVIHQLKSKGYNIISSRKKTLNQFNEQCNFSTYNLGE